MAKRDYYEVLGVTRNASEEELARHANFLAGLKDPLWLS